MDRIADRFAGRNVKSIFLYTNEAHPGERYPHHRTFEQKRRQSGGLVEEYGVGREIYLDSLEGHAHLAYGGMPNMTWVFSRSGLVLYKSDWTDARSVESAVDYYLEVAERRRAKQRLAPFRVERVDFHERNAEGFHRGLVKAGPKAVREFDEAFGGEHKA